MNDNMNLLDTLTVMSFILQLQNNDELQQQTSNDQVLKKLHEDVMLAVEDNRKLCNKIIEQNNDIIRLLKGE